jgi:hypothetical protein
LEKKRAQQMASIESLLNPLPDQTGSNNHHEDDVNISYFHRSSISSLPSRQESNTFSQFQSQTPPNKKPRVAKDAPIFIPGSVRGEVRYPPCADQIADGTFAEEHAKFSIYPRVEDIADFPRHIPYSSEKKSLMEKTGRESFEGMPSPPLPLFFSSLYEFVGLMSGLLQCFNIRSSCLGMRRLGR